MTRLAIFLFVLALSACTYRYHNALRQTYLNANSLMHQTGQPEQPFLKAHLRNGDVVIFGNDWQYDSSQAVVAGAGKHFDFNRNLVRDGPQQIAVGEVALFETNAPEVVRDRDQIAALTVITALNVIGAAICLTMPKACFGSCPTFYYGNESHIRYADAEGFSNAIAPAFECCDLDALNNASTMAGGTTFHLTMKNEALETHSINTVQLLAAPRRPGERVYHDRNGQFLRCSGAATPRRATGPEGDILPLLQASDAVERFTATDSMRLDAKEFLYLEFDPPQTGKQPGLLLQFRQTLVTTFLLYSAYGYMGDEVSDYLAEMETNPRVKAAVSNPFDLLGGIRVDAWDVRRERWVFAGELYETGPIARNLQVVPLPAGLAGQMPIKLRLQLAKGLWRLDYAALTGITAPVEPQVLAPECVEKNGREHDAARRALSADDNSYEVSLPGDTYRLTYQMPPGAEDYEIILASKGYYLEWIRGDWLLDKNPAKLRRMLLNDPSTWKSLAREFKTLEADAENAFWNSMVESNKTTGL